jgi:chaperonin GroES
MQLLPIGDKLLIQPEIVEEVTSGGIYLPETARTTPDKGVVLAVGDDVKSEHVTEGTLVLFRKNSGSTVTYQNKEYIIISIKEVIGVVKPMEKK